MRLTGGTRHDFLLVGFRLLQNALRLASGTWDDVVAIGFGFVLGPVLVGARRLHVAEGGNHRFRRVNFLRLDLGDENAGIV